MEGLSESHTLKSFALKRTRELRWRLEQSGEGQRCFFIFLITFFFFLRRNTDVFVGWWEQCGRDGVA